MSDTPRTDAEGRKPENAGRVNAVIDSEFARLLERELNAANDRYEHQRKRADDFEMGYRRLSCEIVDARETTRILDEYRAALAVDGVVMHHGYALRFIDDLRKDRARVDWLLKHQYGTGILSESREMVEPLGLVCKTDNQITRQFIDAAIYTTEKWPEQPKTQ